MGNPLALLCTPLLGDSRALLRIPLLGNPLALASIAGNSAAGNNVTSRLRPPAHEAE